MACPVEYTFVVLGAAGAAADKRAADDLCTGTQIMEDLTVFLAMIMVEADDVDVLAVLLHRKHNAGYTYGVRLWKIAPRCEKSARLLI